jgi:TPR repeat protein
VPFYTSEEIAMARNSKHEMIALKRAAEDGDTTAMFNYGCAIYTSDASEAVKWWEKAARSGNANAMYNLGAHFAGQQDGNAATAWMLQAAAAGDPDAKEALGLPRDFTITSIEAVYDEE